VYNTLFVLKFSKIQNGINIILIIYILLKKDIVTAINTKINT
jgi:hypothetical protein